MEIFISMDRRFYFLFSIILLIDIFDHSFKKSLTNFLSFNKAEILKQSLKIFLLYSLITLNFCYS